MPGFTERPDVEAQMCKGFQELTPEKRAEIFEAAEEGALQELAEDLPDDAVLGKKILTKMTELIKGDGC